MYSISGMMSGHRQHPGELTSVRAAALWSLRKNADIAMRAADLAHALREGLRRAPREVRASTMSGIFVRPEEIGSGYAGLCTYGSQSRCLQCRMAGHSEWGHASIWILPPHGDVVAFANSLESKCLKGLDYAALIGIAREAGHQMATPASATKASITGESSAIDSSPNV